MSLCFLSFSISTSPFINLSLLLFSSLPVSLSVSLSHVRYPLLFLSGILSHSFPSFILSLSLALSIPLPFPSSYSYHLLPPSPLTGHHPVSITNFITSDVMYDVQSILLYDPTWRCTVYCAVLYAHLKNKEAFSYLGRKFFCLDSCTRTMKAEIPTRVRQ